MIRVGRLRIEAGPLPREEGARLAELVAVQLGDRALPARPETSALRVTVAGRPGASLEQTAENVAAAIADALWHRWADGGVG